MSNTSKTRKDLSEEKLKLLRENQKVGLILTTDKVGYSPGVISITDNPIVIDVQKIKMK